MNILIADSGSTKTDWVLMKDEEQEYFQSVGLNPYFNSQNELTNSIKEVIGKNLYKISIDKIYFYGSGCGNPSTKGRLETAIETNFPSAEIVIESDLLAAGIACYGEREGIVCILGTGSNTCIYNSGKIIQRVPSLGFVLGDEGSGSYFGRKILNNYFYEELPSDLISYLDETTDMDLESILLNTYSKPQANRYVASFAKLLAEKSDHSFIKEMVRTGFEEFTDKQLNYFKEVKNMDISFVGSIANTFKDILEEVLSERNMKLAQVIKTPIERLAEYHSGSRS